MLLLRTITTSITRRTMYCHPYHYRTFLILSENSRLSLIVSPVAVGWVGYVSIITEPKDCDRL